MEADAGYYPVPPLDTDLLGVERPDGGMKPPGPLAHDAAGSVRMVCVSCGREHRRSARVWADGKGHTEWCVWCPEQRLAFVRPAEAEPPAR